VPLSINQTWSIDFMSDSLNTGRKIRTFNVIDDYNRKCLGIEVDHSLPVQRVIKSLEQLIDWRGKPTQNAYIERFNRAARNEWLNLYTFDSIEHAQSLATQCIITNDLIVQLVEFHQESYLRLFKQRRFYF